MKLSFSSRVRELRERIGISQKELAERTKLTPATISRIESGEVDQCNQESLVRLADCLQVSIDYLVGRIDSEKEVDQAQFDAIVRYFFKVYKKISGAQRERLIHFLRSLDTEDKNDKVVRELKKATGVGKIEYWVKATED